MHIRTDADGNAPVGGRAKLRILARLYNVDNARLAQGQKPFQRKMRHGGVAIGKDRQKMLAKTRPVGF